MKKPKNINIRQARVKPFNIPVRCNPLDIYKRARLEHYSEVWRIIKQTFHDVNMHRLLLKQARLNYKIMKRG